MNEKILAASEKELIPLKNETTMTQLEQEEKENAKNGSRIFWFVVGAFALAAIIAFLI